MAVPLRRGIGFTEWAPILSAGRVMPRGQSVRTNQLSLFTVRPYGAASTGGQNRVRNAKGIAKQLKQCEERLAEQQRKEMPRWRRCDFCGGREDTTAPHAHRAA